MIHLNALLRHLPSSHGFPTRHPRSSHPHNPQRKQQEETLHHAPPDHLPVHLNMNGVEQERCPVLDAVPFYELPARITRTPTLLELAWKREKGIVKIVDDSVQLLCLVLDVVVDAHELRLARAHTVQLRVNSPSNSHLFDRFIHVVIDHLKRHRRIAHCHKMRIKRECRKEGFFCHFTVFELLDRDAHVVEGVKEEGPLGSFTVGAMKLPHVFSHQTLQQLTSFPTCQKSPRFRTSPCSPPTPPNTAC